MTRPRMDAWRRRFLRIVLSVIAALQLPFAVLVHQAWSRVMSPSWAVLAMIVTVLVVNLPLVVRLLLFSDSSRPSFARIWLFEMPYYVHFGANLITGPLGALAILGLTGARLVGSHTPAIISVLAPLYAFSMVLGVYATYVRRFWTPVRRVRVPVKDLPRELVGYTIAQLSDVHCGPYMPQWFYRRLARRTSALDVDMVALTGDMISDGTAYLADVTDLVARLKARDGVFACMGNHDYFGTVDGVADAMTAGGAHVLRNAGTTIVTSRAGGSIHVAGIEDTWTKRDDLARTLAMHAKSAPCVLLAHDPVSYPAVVARDEVDLVLSGHTHAGQLALPFFVARFNLARVRYPFSSGKYTQGRTTLYVHPGNGITGPPSRFGAAPEIAVLELVGG